MFLAILMSTHNVCFCEEISRIIPQLSPSALLICSSVLGWSQAAVKLSVPGCPTCFSLEGQRQPVVLALAFLLRVLQHCVTSSPTSMGFYVNLSILESVNMHQSCHPSIHPRSQVDLILVNHKSYEFEPQHDKTNKMAFAPSEDSDQPGHPPSLISVFAVHMKKACALSYPLSTQRRLIRMGIQVLQIVSTDTEGMLLTFAQEAPTLPSMELSSLSYL